VSAGEDAYAAIAAVRRPGAIQTPAQEALVRQFAKSQPGTIRLSSRAAPGNIV
jgi:hypothetical protein